jgi:Transglutaminase-like superfamily/Histidine kinase-, DNA gyrase B-, and HSP90-like ATPase
VSGTVTGGPPPDPTRAFRERARLEADRYGPDPWIFVRELLQNSRDAGAGRVRFVVEQIGEIERVTCIDDGDGMTFEHAKRYLFSLYASSKEGAKNQAGKFGVGFWSVLRFEPSSIVIRSGTEQGGAWGLQLDGALANAMHVEPGVRSGTEIVLERPRGDGRLEHRVFDAVWQSARYLHHRDELDRPVVIEVNGRPANAEFSLGAPSTAFRKRELRGVVGLGSAPRVELFCRGLRVRAAACLDDLIAPAGRHTSRMRVLFPELPGGLAPQALLESEQLELLLSRSDARDNRALQKLVRLAQRELERLVERQLAHARPQPWFSRVFEWVRGLMRGSLFARSLVGAATGGCIALLLSQLLWGTLVEPTPAPGTTVAVANDAVAVAEPSPGPRPYRDLGARYRGPKVDVLSPASAEPVELTYRPSDARLYLAALTFSRLARDGSPLHEVVARAEGDYLGTACGQGCVEITMPMASDGTPTRVPVPTGHRIVTDSARIDDDPATIRSSSDGHPLLLLDRPRTGVLRYRSSPATDPSRARRPEPTAALPGDLERLASRVQALPRAERVQLLLDEVRRSVRYDRSVETADQHVLAAKQGLGFIERTLRIGAGDCDVQNGLLVALLQSAAVPSRLAVGYVGSEGHAMPWLHAWVEYRGEDGSWRIADASDRIAPESLPPAVAVAGVQRPPDDGGDDPELWQAMAADSEPSVPTMPEPTMPEPTTPAPAGELLAAPAPASAMTEEPAPSELTPAAEHATLARLAELDHRFPWVLRAIPFALIGFSLWLLFGARMRRATKLDDSADLSRLLQGVLQQPGAFGHVAALFHRPLVPLCDGDAISLHRARQLSARGRLYRTRTRGALASRAIKAGAAVLDDRTAEGRTVADALGAVDLDRWNALLERSAADRVVAGVNVALRDRAEDWCLRVGPEVATGMAVLDLVPLGVRLPGTRASRLVVLDTADPVLRRAQELAQESLGSAVLLVLDHVAGRLGVGDVRRSHLLAGVARAALFEAFGP